MSLFSFKPSELVKAPVPASLKNPKNPFKEGDEISFKGDVDFGSITESPEDIMLSNGTKAKIAREPDPINTVKLPIGFVNYYNYKVTVDGGFWATIDTNGKILNTGKTDPEADKPPIPSDKPPEPFGPPIGGPGWTK